jgi:hypothetical protein
VSTWRNGIKQRGQEQSSGTSELEGNGRSEAFLRRGADRAEDKDGVVGLHVGWWPPAVYGHRRITIYGVARACAGDWREWLSSV